MCLKLCIRYQSSFKQSIKMASRIIILKDCRYYLKNINLCNNGPYYIRHIKIPDTLAHIACIFLQSLAAILLLVFCFESGFNLTTVSSAFGVSIGVSQLSMMYITLAANKDLIFETVQKLQRLVDYS